MLRCLGAISAVLMVMSQSLAAEKLQTVSERFGADTQDLPSFQRHVLPLLGRLGCNGRACHGSFQGRGGFRLSLFGYDFKSDFDALLARDRGRVDRDDPAESLILRKPTLALAHKGGKRMEAGGWQYKLLLRWIGDGAQNDDAGKVRLEHLSVTPSQRVFARLGDHVRLRVVAHWSDGTTEDVTELTRFRSNDEALATVDEQGMVTSAGKGDTHIVAFYDNGIAPVQVMLPVSERNGARYPEVPAPTQVDKLVVAKLRALGLVPSELCTDGEFLRRVSVDITGTLPTAAEVESFLADAAADKRSRKVEELLARPAYAAWWTTKLCDLTGNNGRHREAGPVAQEFARQWYDWVFARVQANTGYDKIVAGMVLATSREQGKNLSQYSEEMSSYFRKDKPADFSVRQTMPHFWSRTTFQNPDDRAVGFGYAFLGLRLQCAQCHKHPFDQWTKQDFEQFKAFFGRIVYGVPPRDRETFAKMTAELGEKFPALKGAKAGTVNYSVMRDGAVVPWQEVYVAEAGDNGSTKGKPKPAARKPGANKSVTARLLGDEQVSLKPDADPREPVLHWLLRSDNPYFARAFVNRLWASYFNAGIVEPPDDLNQANPPSNAALLDYLARGFVEHDYDLKWLHREIATSRTYQLSWKPNDSNRLDTRNFSHAVPRRLPAEVAYDAIDQATAREKEIAAWQSDHSKRIIAAGSSVNVKGKGGANYVLTVFGKPDRTGNCDCERSNDPSLLQTLFLLNDGEVQRLISRPDGWVAELSRTTSAPGKAQKGAAKQRPRIEPLSADEEQKFIREAYLRTLSRAPTANETARCREYLRASETPVSGMRDVLWALLNTNEFIVNH